MTNNSYLRFFRSGKLSILTIIIILAVILSLIIGRALLDWQPLTLFYTFIAGTLLNVLFAQIALVTIVISMFKRDKQLAKSSSITFVSGMLLAFIALFTAGTSGLTAPPIHDISTDTENPPEFIKALKLRIDGDSTTVYEGETVAEIQQRAFPDIQTINTEMSPEDAFQNSLSTIEILGWTLIDADKISGRIEAYDESKLFGFIDDVVIRISTKDHLTNLDVRSISRVGIGDLGANANRIRQFRNEFLNKT